MNKKNKEKNPGWFCTCKAHRVLRALLIYFLYKIFLSVGSLCFPDGNQWHNVIIFSLASSLMKIMLLTWVYIQYNPPV